MEIIYFFVICLAIFAAKIIYNESGNKNKLRVKLMSQFGKVPTTEYTSERFESIQKYYQHIKDEKMDVDDITWNDVDMDEIFMLANNTCTSIGEEYLYAMLRKLQYDDKRLKKVDELADYFTTHAEERLQLQMKLSRIGRMKVISVYEYINLFKGYKEESVAKHIFQAIGLLVTIALIPFNPSLGILLTVVMLATNTITYFKSKQEMEPYFNIVNYIAKLLKEVGKINRDSANVIQDMMKETMDAAKKLNDFKKAAGIIGRGDGDLLDVLMDYIRMLFHIDIIQFCRVSKIFRKYTKELNQIYENIGFIDSCIAIASFRKLLPYYSKPELHSDKKPELNVDEIYHSLIENPVVNSIHEKKSILLTGSNASGKSTFIKTLAINAILSQTIYTSLSKKYEASYFNVATSMALRDNIFSQESYYIVEIKSLKRILDRVNPEVPILCFVDEILRGTNTLERIAASSEILVSLARKNVLCFAATHDIELTHILEDDYSNYHFQEQIVDNNILFDYKLYEGRAVSKNAIKLLSIMGYSNEIIERATDAANHFQETGKWKNIVRK